MTRDQEPRPLRDSDVDLSVDPAELGFQTTDELEPLSDLVGQPRAIRALDLALGIRHKGYNVYLAGSNTTVDREAIRRELSERARQETTPDDWIYVNNFDEPDRPLAIALPAGQGARLKRELGRLVEQLFEDLPKAFRQEDFSRERQRIGEQYQKRRRGMVEELEKLAAEKGLGLEQLPNGQIVLLPLKDGEPMKPEEVEQLSDAEREEIGRRQREVARQAEMFLARQEEMGRELHSEVRAVERSFATRQIEPLVRQIAEHYESKKLRDWLDKLKDHMIEHLERFHRQEDSQQQQLAAMLGVSPPSPDEQLLEYDVNVLVDNSDVEGAPVIVEESPNYKNLFGTIERAVDRFGKLVTNFTRIKGGSLVRANGGYLVFNMLDALVEPLVWKELKRRLKAGTLEIETYDPFAIFSTSALKPEPVPLTVKLVVIGNPLVYHLLYLYDEDFSEIFKVKAEFAPEMDRGSQTGQVLGRLIKKLGRDENLPPFGADAVAELVRTAARLADDQRKQTTEFTRLADLARETVYWARQDGAATIGRRHVRRAVDESVYRSDWIAEKIRELIEDGTLRIRIDGKAVGQVNGLAVADLGDYAFGRPSRVTASVGVGGAGVINIERESKLSGRTFDKGVLILDGYLRNKYAGDHPLALSASLAMEQSYGMIDGDSASAAELICLLSALGRVPLRQDVAITGSVNQWGEIQAIGGVNEKVEGFFDVCKQHGLTGRQGVCVPEANVKNLVLRPDVVEAIRDEKFHLWAIGHVDQGLRLLGEMPAGDLDERDSFHWRVDRRLAELAEAIQEHKAGAVVRERTGWEPVAAGNPDPRPPLPGRDAPDGGRTRAAIEGQKTNVGRPTNGRPDSTG